MHVERNVGKWVFCLISTIMVLGGFGLIIMDINKRLNMMRDTGCDFFEADFDALFGAIIVIGFGIFVLAFAFDNIFVTRYLLSIGMIISGSVFLPGPLMGCPKMFIMIIFFGFGILILVTTGKYKKNPEKMQSDYEVSEFSRLAIVRDVISTEYGSRVIFELMKVPEFMTQYVCFDTQQAYFCEEKRMIDIRKLDDRNIITVENIQAIDATGISDDDFMPLNPIIEKLFTKILDVSDK